MGLLLLKGFSGFIIGTYFGKLAAKKLLSQGKALFLTITLTIILCTLIDLIVGV